MYVSVKCVRSNFPRRKFIFCPEHSNHEQFHLLKVPTLGYCYILEENRLVDGSVKYICRNNLMNTLQPIVGNQSPEVSRLKSPLVNVGALQKAAKEKNH